MNQRSSGEIYPLQPETYLTITNDLSAIESTERNEKLRLLSDRILRLDATNEEIEDWVYGLDPLHEQRNLTGIEIETEVDGLSKIPEHNQEYDAIARTLFYGGLLLAHRAFEGDRSESLQKLQHLSMAQKQENDTHHLTPRAAIKSLESKLIATDEFTPNEETCRVILLAADMLFEYNLMVNPIRSQVAQHVMHDEAAMQRFHETYPNILQSTTYLYELVADLANNQEQIDALKFVPLEASKRMAHIVVNEGMNLEMLRKNNSARYLKVGELLDLYNFASCESGIATRLMQDDSHEQVSDISFTTVAADGALYFADTIKKTFLGTNGFKTGLMYNENIAKSDIRGSLYEAMWQLDFLMLQITQGKPLPAYFPAYSFQDRPKIGFPELRRGYDAKIIGQNGYSRLLQLKSSKSAASRKNNYHPAVDTIAEDNFLDVDPRRLSRKLKIYEDALIDIRASRKLSPQMTEKMLSYILPSVKEAFDEAHKNKTDHSLGNAMLRFANIHGKSTTQLHEAVIIPAPPSMQFKSTQGNISLNRAERRALEKQNKSRRK